MRPGALAAVLWLACGSTTACAHQQKSATPTPPLPTPPPPRTMADAKGLTEFANTVRTYVALQDKAEAALPRLPDRTEPAKVAAHQKALAEAIRQSGPRPRPGHVFEAHGEGRRGSGPQQGEGGGAGERAPHGSRLASASACA